MRNRSPGHRLLEGSDLSLMGVLLHSSLHPASLPSIRLGSYTESVLRTRRVRNQCDMSAMQTPSTNTHSHWRSDAVLSLGLHAGRMCIASNG